MDATSNGDRRRHSRPRIKPDGIPVWAYAAAGGCLTLAFAYVAYVPLVQDREAEALTAAGVRDDCGVPGFCAGAGLGAVPGTPAASGSSSPAPEATSTSEPPAATTPPVPAPAPRPTVAPLPAPPSVSRQFFVSNWPFQEVANGRGPVERDLSNGEADARDGSILTIAGQTFAKGLGVHAPSNVQLVLAGKCSRFTAQVGIDDEKDAKDQDGRVIFRLVADGREVFESGERDFRAEPLPVDIPVSGVRVLNLIVDSAGPERTDHADWADARITCVSN